MRKFIVLALSLSLAFLLQPALGQSYYIESRDSGGAVTPTTLYEESTSPWQVVLSSSTAKSTASGLSGAGCRFSSATYSGAYGIFKIGNHASFVPGVYDIYVTVPSSSSSDAANTQYAIYDCLSPYNTPIGGGTVPLTYTAAGNTWLLVQSGVTLNSDAAIRFDEGTPQVNRFVMDAIRFDLVQTLPTFTLTIASGQGSALPAVGTYEVTSGSLVNASVTSPASGGTGVQYVCTGYTGTGDFGSGSGTSVSATVLSNSSLTWNWLTQYQMTVTASPAAGGTVTGSGWYDSGQPAAVEATANPSYVFTGWSGDLTGSTNPDNVTMDAPKTVTANFSAPTIDLPETAHDFGVTIATAGGGSPVDYAFQVLNTGVPTLTLSVSQASGSSDFSLVSAPASLAGNTSDTITIRYTPDTYGPVSAVFNVISNDPTATTSTLTVSGSATNPTAVVGDAVALGDWTPASAPTMNDSGNDGDAVPGDGIYTLSIDIGPTTSTWKVLKDKTLGWGGGNDVGRQADTGNMPDAGTTGTITYYYDTRDLTAQGWLPATEGLGSSALSNIPWAAVGDFQAWDPDSATTVMHDDGLDGDAAAGDGIFSYKFQQSGDVTDSPWKVVSQLTIGGDPNHWLGEYKFGTNGMSQDPNDSTNATYTAKDGQFVLLEYDAWMGHIRSTVSGAPSKVDNWRIY